MKKTIFKGSGTALITPFSGGEIDYQALARLIEYQISCGTDALIIGGTTAEAATLSDTERYRLYSFARGEVDGRVKLIFGTGTNDTRVAIAHTKFAERIGCDGVLLVTPYYNKGTESGIEKHYLAIAESTDLPTILYNVPSRTGVNLGFNLLRRLSEHENIVAIKEASDSLDRMVFLSEFGEDLALYAGNDSQIYPVMALGGLGVISVISNLMPCSVKELCQHCTEGRWQSALRLQLKMLPLIRTLFLETNPSPIKYAMSVRQMCSGELRLPLDEPRDTTKAEILRELDRLLDMK